MVFLVVAALPLLLAVLAMLSRTGEVPGLREGRLASCPDRPNCVSSETNEPSRRVEPLEYSPVPDRVALEQARAVLSGMDAEIRIQGPGYLAATFSSSLFGFVDDFELRLDPVAQRLHVRAASRVGYSDGGVNRKRVDRFRQRMDAALSAAE